MKRSDAIKKIEWYINEQNSGIVVGEQILNFVEGLGMLPPTIKNPLVKQDNAYSHSTQKALDNLYNRNTRVPDDFYINEWELEDE